MRTNHLPTLPELAISQNPSREFLSLLQTEHASTGENNVDKDGMTRVKYVNASLSWLELAELLTMQDNTFQYLQPILEDHR